MHSLLRRMLKAVHPEGIPRPGALVYNAISRTKIFQAAYDLLARDILDSMHRGAVLDIGTGPGALLIKIARMRHDLRLTGLDISPAMVSAARRNFEKAGLSSAIEVVEGSASSLPFENGSFDLVVSTGSLHHWANPAGGMNEIHRVLKRGGRALIYDLVADMPKPSMKEFNREFGFLRTTLLWLHTFTEPFHSSLEMELLARSSLFATGSTRFVGLFCCLMLEKEEE